MLYSAIPGSGFLKVMCEGRRDIGVVRVAGFEPFAAPKMSSRAPWWRLSFVEHLSIQGMRELILEATTGARISCGTQDVLLAHQALAEILKIIGIHSGCRGARCGFESRAEDTCCFERSLLLRAEALDLRFDHLSQRFRYTNVDLGQRNLDLPGPILPRDETSPRQMLQQGNDEQRITLGVSMHHLG